METLFINIAKSSGLIGMFYIAYHLLLRKETFFTANRWFLLAGLLTSVILPWIVFTTIVWVEPTPTNIDWSKIPQTTPTIQKESVEINWNLVLVATYLIGIALLFIQFAFDFYNLNQVLKGKNIHRQADHKFIDVKENIAPFSYFNTIVYNSSLYSESEMENILEHEKVHSEQYHTVDVLISRIFCILFWFNPFIWLYKKAILQNLEFIADSEATKNLSDKKAYQLTLLKITTHENCVVLTNHFYQSLIKKRIVMLNKNQSKKWKCWKYTLVLPVLIAFVLLFQIEAIAQKSTTTSTKNVIVEYDAINHIYSISKTTTNQALDSEKKLIKEKFNTDIVFSEIKRNSKNEITAIKVEITTPNKEKNIFIYSDNLPITEFQIFGGHLKNKETVVGLYVLKPSNGTLKNNKWKQTISYIIPPPPPPRVTKTIIAPPPPSKKTTTPPALPPTVKTTQIPPPPKVSTVKFTPPKEKATINDSNNDAGKSMNVSKDESTIKKNDENDKTNFHINGPVTLPPIIIINGVKSTSVSSVNEINPDAIKSMNILKGKTAEDKYGKDGKYGVIEIITNTLDPSKIIKK